MNVKEKMDFLGFKEVTTKRQKKNGTQIFELPIKCGNTYIKVGSFESGYIRRMNHCYTPYQLNKCKYVPQYYKDYSYETGKQVFTGKYRKYIGKQRIVIPNKIERLEYLVAYCLKNFYINYANQVANGDFVTKWKHEWELERVKKQFYGAKNVSVNIDGIRYKVI